MKTKADSRHGSSLIAALVSPYAPATEMRRFDSLDSLRFLAALSIVFVHCNMISSAYGWSDSKNYILEFNLSVDFFFILSGFVIETTYGGRMANIGDYGRFLRARLARIYPLHVLVVLVCIPMCLAAAGGIHFRAVTDWLHLSFVPGNLLLLQSFNIPGAEGLNVASWSISAEMAMYLTFPLTLLALRHLRPIGTIFLAWLAFLLFDGLSSQPWTLATSDFGVFRAVPGFLIGAAISTTLRRFSAPQITSRDTSLIVGVIALFMACTVDPDIIVLLLPLAVAIPALADRNGSLGIYGRRFMLKLGNASYSIYMLNIPILFILTDVLDRALLAPQSKAAIVFIATPLITVALALVLYGWFEAPMRALLSGRRQNAAIRVSSGETLAARATS